MKPLISIVTVTYNPGLIRIQKTISSVINQIGRSNIEYGIIDGGSTDGTVEFLIAHQNLLDFFISEKDRGIYDAMNKGVLRAQGTWILFLNAGDCLYSQETVTEISTILQTQCPDILYGDCIQEYPFYSIYDKASPLHRLPYQMIASHQSMICKRSLLLEHPFNLSYHICGDFDFTCRMYIKGKTFFYYNKPISVIEPEGFSSIHYKQNLSEKRKIVLNYFPEKKIKLWLFYTQKIIFLPLISLIKKNISARLLFLLRKRKYHAITTK